MKTYFTRFIIRLIPFTLILFLIQYLVVAYLMGPTEFYYPTFAIYLFHFLTTLLIYLGLLLVYKHYKDYTGFGFMAASFLKMVAAIVFLLPMLLNYTGNAFANLLAFFIPYFLFLIFETLYAVKLINSK